ESHEGRPTKIEGNPAHTESEGATDAVTQASILSLYDPDRSQSPMRDAAPATWVEFEAAWRVRMGPGRGDGGALLAEPTSSPTLQREIHALLDGRAGARWYQHTPLCRYDEGGEAWDLRPGEADVILAVGSDFLFRHPAALRYAR